MDTSTRQLLFASTNLGKVKEAKLCATRSQITLLGAQDISISGESVKLPEVVEDAPTYCGNAEKKARAYAELFSLPTIADDTGLEVFALDNAPGLYSARYAGEPVNSERNMQKLLAALEGKKDRRAKFVCWICLVLPREEKAQFFSGELYGQITTTPRGSGGFGYDSVFYVPELQATLAELKERGAEPETHRTRALAELFSKKRY